MSAPASRQPLVEPGPELSRADIERFARHLALPGIGVHGQRRLRAAAVLVVGAGGLGAPILQYLAAAGIGQLTVIDDDVVEASNLQRQVLHREADVGRAKVESARDAIHRIDGGLSVTALNERLTPENARALFAAHDIVLDGADNFATRYLSNDAAELTGTPVVWGTIFRFAGQVSTFWPGVGPMLRDLFPDIPDADSVPNCAEGGVLGVLCGTVGSAMATEAIKLICGIGEPLIGRLLRYDALTAESSTLRFVVDPERSPVTDLDEVAAACRTSESVREPEAEIDAEQLGQRRAEASGDRDLVLIDVREDWEREITSIPGSLHVPLDRIDAHGWAALPEQAGTTAELVLYCAGGVRSLRARDRLVGAAPRDIRIHSLAGGIDAWARAEHAHD